MKSSPGGRPFANLSKLIALVHPRRFVVGVCCGEESLQKTEAEPIHKANQASAVQKTCPCGLEILPTVFYVAVPGRLNH